MTRKNLAPLILAFTFVPAVGLASTPEEILKGAWQDPAVKASEQAMTVVSEGQGFNPIKQTQLRVERGEIQKDSLEYALRLYPKGFTEFSKGKSFQKSLEKSEKAISKNALSQSLAQRYLLLARAALLQAKLDLANQLADLNRKSGKAAAYTAQRDRAELKSFLKSRVELDKHDLKVAEIQRDYAALQDDFKSRGLGDPKGLDLSDLVQPEDVRGRITAVPQPSETLTGQVARLEAETADAAFNYERAQNEAWLDHVEISAKRLDRDEKIFGVRLSINLPFASAPDMSDIQKAAKEAREKAEKVQISRESGALFRQSVSELTTLLDLHSRLTKERSRLSPSQMKKTSQAVSGRDPLLALEFQRGWYESYEQLLDVEFRIRELYVSYLVESTALAEAPEVNYLSKTKKRIL
jgi:hypothetical protein